MKTITTRENLVFQTSWPSLYVKSSLPPPPTHTQSPLATGNFALTHPRGQAGGLLPFPVPVPLLVGSWLEQ